MPAAHKAKFAATRFAAVRHLQTDPQFTQRIVLEMVSLENEGYKSEKVEVQIADARNEEHSKGLIKDALVLHLNARFPAEHYTERDILLYGF